MRSPTRDPRTLPVVSDAALIAQVMRGRTDSFRLIYRRHYPAVHSYALTCTRTPLDALELTSHAFVQVLQGMISGELHPDSMNGALRLRLLELVRSAAIQSCVRDGEGFSPQFRQWVATGAAWTLDDVGHLVVGWKNAPREAQCLLWHVLVERDTPVSVSRLTGIPDERINTARIGALAAVRYGRATPYLAQMDLPEECRAAIERLLTQPQDSSALQHCYACPDCFEVYQDLAHVERRLEAQLPLALLGWWPVLEYLNLKATIPVPLTDPPFLDRAVRQASELSGAPAAKGSLRGLAAVLSPRPLLAAATFIVGAGLGAIISWVMVTTTF